MVHDHAGGLHEGVADGRADKGEAGFLQGLAHGLGFIGNRRYLAAAAEVVDLRRAADERPQPFGGVIHSQPGLGIAPRSLELEAIADDACILHQFFDAFVAHGRQLYGVEAVHHLAITLAFAQNGNP
ncbi:hypothetical protein D3C80_1703960 [compost metagenome]